VPLSHAFSRERYLRSIANMTRLMSRKPLQCDTIEAAVNTNQNEQPLRRAFARRGGTPSRTAARAATNTLSCWLLGSSPRRCKCASHRAFDLFVYSSIRSMVQCLLSAFVTV
jgi:hypothetical protein